MLDQVGTVYSKVLKERLPVFLVKGRLVPCVCEPKTHTVCYLHAQLGE
jgi:hypothetical protein